MDKENHMPEMDQMSKPDNSFQMSKPVKKPHSNTMLMLLLALVLVGAAAGTAYWLRGKNANNFEKNQAADMAELQQKNTSLAKQLADEKAKAATPTTTATPTACVSKSPSADTIGNIEASITSGNTAALEGFMASSVNVVTAASGNVGVKTTSQAVSSISSFITPDNTAWDYVFKLPAATLSTYSKSSYGKYFPSNAVVGKAANKYVISFSFDCNAKISTVFMAVNENLIK